MKKIYYLMALCVMIFTSCQKEEEVGGTAMQSMAGEWFVRMSADGGKTFGPDYYHFSTYNTADNSQTTMWFDDLKTFWQTKGKVSVNLENKTFSGENIKNVTYADSFFTVLDGKLLEKAAKASGSKTVTDSIYFKMRFSDDDDPSTEYVFAGYRKTGFLEDEH
jgi:hypothetical protein